MALQKTEAIVLKSQRQGETSKILTLYTRKFGKMKVIAKGARSTRSRFAGTLEPTNYIAIVFYEKDTRELQFLSQAEIIETFAKKKQNLEKAALSLAACELVDRLEVGAVSNPRLFKLLLESLRATHQARGMPMNCFRAFQIHLLELIGIKPELGVCIRCKHASSGEAVFDIRHGGFYCERCLSSRPPGMFITAETIHALKIFQKSAFTNLNGLALSPAAEQQIEVFLNAYFNYHIEGFKELNAIKFLKKISSRSQ
jgi:DNA repair protein RecO (recombination protein O)